MEEDAETIYKLNCKKIIRFFPDWGREHPLWESGTDKYAMDPDDYGLSDSLSRRLAEWMRHWESNRVPETGWTSADAATESERTGDALVADLRIEVASFAEVRDERRRSDCPAVYSRESTTEPYGKTDHTISMVVHSVIFMDGSLPELHVGDVVSVSLQFDADVDQYSAGVDNLHVTVSPDYGKAPFLDTEGTLQWPFKVTGDGWSARWFYHSPFASRLRLPGRLYPDFGHAIPGQPDTTTGRVRRLQLVEERYESTASGRQRVPGTERVTDLDPESDPYWPNWSMFPSNDLFQPTAIVVELDLDDVPVAPGSFDAGTLDVSGTDVWVMDRSTPLLLHIDTSHGAPRVTEYLLPLAAEPPNTMWTRRIHADHDGCWITTGDEIVRCTRDGPAELTLQRVSTDSGIYTVALDGRLFVLSYPHTTVQFSDRYGHHPGRFQILELVGDELVPVSDEATIARVRAHSGRADIATTPEGATWTAAGRVTVKPADGTRHTVDLHPRFPGRVHWVRPHARSGQGVDEIAIGSYAPLSEKPPNKRS